MLAANLSNAHDFSQRFITKKFLVLQIKALKNNYLNKLRLLKKGEKNIFYCKMHPHSNKIKL